MKYSELRQLIREEIESELMEESFEIAELTPLLYLFSGLAIGLLGGDLLTARDAEDSLLGNWYLKLKSKWDNFKFKKNVQPIIDRLKQDPEVQSFFKQSATKQRGGWQNLLKQKLTDKEMKYLNQINKKYMR